jgi:hypothetical protein
MKAARPDMGEMFGEDEDALQERLAALPRRWIPTGQRPRKQR